MRDWKTLVRQQLKSRTEAAADLEEIAEEIGQQMEDVYSSALEQGLSREEALRKAEDEVPDWGALAAEIESLNHTADREHAPRLRRRRISSRGTNQPIGNPVTGSRSKGRMEVKMLEILHELHASIRSLVRRPLYPLAAVAILALGLTAGIAVFTYVNGFYQPFPGVEADGLVRIYAIENEDAYQNLSYLDFLDYASSASSFEGIAAAQANYAASVRLERHTEVAFLEAVSGGYFSVLGLQMAAGRGISAADDQPGADPVAVLSHDWWQRSFNSDPSVIGKVIHLNYRPFTVIGVMPPQFRGATADFRPDVWIPFAPFRDRYLGWAALAQDRDVPLVRVYGRLQESVREEAALAELTAAAAGLDAAYPRRNRPRQLRFDAATWISPRSRLSEMPTVRLMMAAAAGLLLLVCANAANLLLSVAVGRQRETSIRAALGASRWRLLRRVLVENLLLSGLAGGVALSLALPASARLGSYFARPSVWGANVAREMALDLHVVAFALAISLATGLASGLLPALRASRGDIVATLKGDGSSYRGDRRILFLRLPNTHDLLISAQVALSIVLLVAAGLVVRTLLSAGSLDPGFRYDSLLVTHISTSSTDVQAPGRERFFRQLKESLSRESWVRSAAVADYPPLSPHASADLQLEGQSETVSLLYSKVVPGFFETLGIGVLQGRGLVEADSAEAPLVALVNQSLAARYFGERSVVGRRIRWSEGEEIRSFEIVGVVDDAKFRDFFTQPEPMVYFSYPQHRYPTGSALLVSTLPDPAAAAPQLYRWLRAYEPHLAIVNVIPYKRIVQGFLYPYRMNAELFSVLALLGLGLTAAGIFSVGSLSVRRRRREIGIRMSIGASRRDIRRLIIGRAAFPLALGLATGLIATLALQGLLRSLLFEIEPTDPLALAFGISLLAAAVVSSLLLPAQRAASVDPVAALRGR